ncbi:MAG: M23 family metallopeptidase [Desulfobacterales bacterium]|nr:M23 family metallopeptidase [Desulfobacterales bacterium]
MQRKITFFVLRDTGRYPIRQASVSKTFLFFLSALITAAIIAFGFIICDYAYLKKSFRNTPDLENRFSIQLNEMKNLQQQLNNFKSKIDTFKSNLVDLNQFEKKIRKIADIKKIESQDSLFGVGGSASDNLELNISHEQKNISHQNKMNQLVEHFDSASKNQREDLKFFLKDCNYQSNLLASTPSIRPVKKGKVISEFGFRQSSLTGKREFHKGIDISNQSGTSVFATGSGLITFAGLHSRLGRLIVIDHGHGMVTRYANLQKILKKKGETVQRGEIIALTGDSEQRTDSYIYYEVRLNGIPINPTRYIF